MSSACKVAIAVTLACLTVLTLALAVPNFHDVVPFWIAPIASIVSFIVAVGLFVSKYREAKWAIIVQYVSLYVYIVSVICISN
ncbi:hypothetical protein CPT_Moabite_280 [Serratia phage Moabite]|uniref:Uncharacterized protein n=2 Tax=Moabitevirus moabite TaxID=2846181 RepID=A0A7T3TM01_9CAUD|nr:hypothetical protein HWC48_gp136 [Serratia phage Moabite]QPX76874.1 hypothetical protein [Serratia phage vB_SmaM_Yaphecito]UCR74801.1 hypothetical protein [Serratia phage BUCT660]UGO54163.1 hypothetical protein HAYMO_181 [Serratia phage vB_SmaM_Haymo]UQT03670.1 hypothetical protein KODAMA_02030 [Serratia phage vB_SmaM-Kodama]QDB71310.1 hypothetical protein CPT_Moabite_280 [Serratia phage Moabite]